MPRLKPDQRKNDFGSYYKPRCTDCGVPPRYGSSTPQYCQAERTSRDEIITAIKSHKLCGPLKRRIAFLILQSPHTKRLFTGKAHLGEDNRFIASLETVGVPSERRGKVITGVFAEMLESFQIDKSYMGG